MQLESKCMYMYDKIIVYIYNKLWQATLAGDIFAEDIKKYYPVDSVGYDQHINAIIDTLQETVSSLL